MATLKPQHEMMIVRPRPDIHGQLSTLVMTGGTIDTALFGKVKTDDLISYKHTGMPNNFAFGEILRVGPGLPIGPSSQAPDVNVGDIIGFDLQKVCTSCPSDEGRKNADGSVKLEEVYFLAFNAALCKFTPTDKLPKPLGNFIFTQEDPEGMDRLLFATRREGTSTLILPDSMRRGGIKSNDNPDTRIRITAERILGVGTGKYVKKVFCEIPDFTGQLAIFTPVLSVDLHAFSKRTRFTPWGQILGVIDL